MMDVIRVLDSFGWLSNLYIIDYFLEDHWSLLPGVWREYFDKVVASAQVLEVIETLLDKTNTMLWPGDVPPPLSLMALRTSVCTRSFQHQRYVRSPAEIAKIFDSQVIVKILIA
jgi:hypothetical protein